VAATVRSCNYHPQALRSRRNSLPHDIAVNIACSIIGSRLDYCNVIYFGIAEANFHKLQRIQNRAVRIVCDVPRRQQHSADVLRQLHWLPMRSRVDFKLAVLRYKAYKLQQPSYLADLLSSYQQPRDLRSSGLDLLSTEASSTTIGTRKFPCAAPVTWNTLPISVRSADSLTCFRSRLKTYLLSRHV